jgi:endonuclease III related protein
MEKIELRSCSVFEPLSLHRILFEHYGPSGWWPGESPFEVSVGAILTQNTAWINVEKAIANLKTASLMDVRSINDLDEKNLASLIRPAGYYNVKARRLKNFIRAVMDYSSGDLDKFFDQDKETLRAALLRVNGIGNETADSICCYAADKIIFVVDAYTRRILYRHGAIEESAGYEDIRMFFESGLPRDLSIYKDLHAHIVLVGKEFCRPRNLRCDVCPLNNRLYTRHQALGQGKPLL